MNKEMIEWKETIVRTSENPARIWKRKPAGKARPLPGTLREVEEGVWTGVLVVEIERLARGDTRDQGYVAEAFTYSDTKIITPLKTYDPADPADQEYFEFNLFMSRREYKTINRRLETGRHQSFLEGKFLGNVAPYGWERYKLDRQKGFSLRPHPQEGKYLVMMYDLVAYGSVPNGIRLDRRHDPRDHRKRTQYRSGPARISKDSQEDAEREYRKAPPPPEEL